MTDIDALTLRKSLTQVLDAASNGETFTISKRGRPIAQLGPITAVAASATPETFVKRSTTGPLAEEEVTTFGGPTTVPPEGKKQG